MSGPQQGSATPRMRSTQARSGPASSARTLETATSATSAGGDELLSRRFAYGFAALLGFVLGNALYSVARHRSLAGAMLLLITILGGLLLLIANQDAVAKRGFRTDAIDRSAAAATFAVLLFCGVLCNALVFD